MNDAWALHSRAWYYMKVFADPKNPDVVWVLNAPVSRSIDGGKTFTNVPRAARRQPQPLDQPDRPADAHRRRTTAAPTCRSTAARTWSTQGNQPTAQFYRVNADNLFPYNVYGGQQDNTSVKIASAAAGRHHRARLVRRRRLRERGAGVRSRQPALRLRRLLHGHHQRVRRRDEDRPRRDGLAADAGRRCRRASMKYRFNWSAPIVVSTLQPDGDLPRRQRAAAVRQPRQDLARGQPRPDAQRQEQAGPRRRADHQRGRGRRDLRRDRRHRRVAARRRARSGSAPTTGSCS